MTKPTIELQSYRQLRVWRRSIALVVEAYRISNALPPDERFELRRQIRRAATSIPANIAEGHGRWHRGDFLHHLSMARGSAAELETHLVVIETLGYIDTTDLARARDHCDAISRMLTALRNALTIAR